MKLKNKKEFLTPAPPNFIWPQCPEADAFVNKTIQQFLSLHPFAARLAERMKKETSTDFSVWIDHFVLPDRAGQAEQIKRLGFQEDKRVKSPPQNKVYFHPFADLPRYVISKKAKAMACAIMVEDLWKFQLAHHLSLPVQGAPMSSYRVMVMEEPLADFLIVERRGSLTLVPDMKKRATFIHRAFEGWVTRQREFSDEAAGMQMTLKHAQSLAKTLGTGMAAHVFLACERVYWESRNAAARIQKTRQDHLGLGWANHDHHTFRSSRTHFATLIQILLAFGFKKRERYYAGEEAGWGAQVMEQPEAGFIIFADVDLTPQDVAIDFSKTPLQDLPKPRTVGLWCALHGESILNAGMHHLEAKFDFDALKRDLLSQGIDTMEPFTDFPHLRQAFTKAEIWRVDETRLKRLVSEGKISNDAYKQILKNGAVGSHLENLERHDGFKGFNQKGVSRIISAVNPEKQALQPDTHLGAA